MERQGGNCADCKEPLTKFVLDHRPPLALRDKDSDPNDPEKIDAICPICNLKKTGIDISQIAKSKRVFASWDKHKERLLMKDHGKALPPGKIRSRGFKRGS